MMLWLLCQKEKGYFHHLAACTADPLALSPQLHGRSPLSSPPSSQKMPHGWQSVCSPRSSPRMTSRRRNVHPEQQEVPHVVPPPMVRLRPASGTGTGAGAGAGAAT